MQEIQNKEGMTNLKPIKIFAKNGRTETIIHDFEANNQSEMQKYTKDFVKFK